MIGKKEIVISSNFVGHKIVDLVPTSGSMVGLRLDSGRVLYVNRKELS